MASLAVKVIFKAVDKITAPIRRMQKSIGRFTRRARFQFKALNRSVDRMAAGARRAAAAVAAAVGIMGIGIAKVINLGADFEQTLVNAAVKFPGEIRKGTAAFEELSDAARKVGRETEFTANQAAEGLNFLALAGFNAKQAIAALPGVVDLATVAQVELKEASDIATDTMGAFGLSVDDAAQRQKNLTRVANVLALTQARTNTDVLQFFEAVKQGGPVAKVAGAQIETFAALVGVMANSSIKASQGGTAVKNLFTRLAAPVGKARATLKKFNVEVDDGTGNMRDVADILADFKKGLEGVGTVEKLKAITDIFGKIPIAGVSAILDNIEDVRTLRAETRNATTAAADMAAMMRDTVRGSLKAAGSAIESVQISLFSMEKGPLKDTIDSFTEWVRGVDLAINSNKELASGALRDLGAGILGLLKLFVVYIAAVTTMKVVTVAIRIAMFAWGTAVKIVGISITVFNAVLKGARLAMIAFNIVLALNPIGLLIGGIVALIAIGALLITNWETVRDFFVGMWDSIGTAFSVGVDFISGLIDTVMETVNSLISGATALSDIFGTGEDGEDGAGGASGADGLTGIVSSGEQTAAALAGRHDSTTNEVILTAAPGTAAEPVGGALPDSIKLVDSAAF